MAPDLLRRLPLVVGLGAGIAAGRVGVLALYLSRLTIAGARQPLWRSPSELGLLAEDLTFQASDGVKLRGWFLRRSDDDGTPAATIVFIHGWPWNRLGNYAGSTLIPDRTVSLLEPARALTRSGFHVLLFDLRNHGESDAALPVTFGVHEARDLAGAVAMLRRRPDVDAQRIGLIGYSMGANTLLYGLPSCQPIRAAVAVQPVKVATFAANFTRAMLGPLGPLLFQTVLPLHQALGGPPLHSVDPAAVAHQVGETEVLYIQGKDDPWGSLADVQAMAAATPRALPVVVAPADDRFAGYRYVSDHQGEIAAFFTERLRG